MTALLPPDELERIEALRRYRILDTPPETLFDHITTLTTELLHVPFSGIAFVDQHRTWYKSRCGLDVADVSRDSSFAAHTILGDDVLAVGDAREDPRFAANPAVAGAPGIRAHAGAPLKTPEGFRLGSLCAMDAKARKFAPDELRILERLAAIVMDELELRLQTREMAEAAERQHERPGLWGGALDSAALGVSITDENGWLVDVNPAYCRITGYSREELIGHHFTMVLPPDTRSEALRAHAAFLEGEERAGSDWRVRRKDGAIIDVQLTAARFVSEDGGRFRVTTTTDVTALKKLEEQLRGMEKMDAVSRLAGGAAHGFNNLLTIITGYSQLLRGSLSEADPLAMYVDEIAAAADRAATLTSKLLAFSRRRFGEPERLDINALVTASVPAMCVDLPSNIEVATDLAPGLAPVHVDRAYLEQAIRDLLTNAREAMPGGGRITVRTASFAAGEQRAGPAHGLRPGNYILLAVEDTGEGIDPEAQKHLFEPFFTTKGVGKGIGLATIYGTVKQCGGEVKVSSTPGQGTVVTLYLPAAR